MPGGSASPSAFAWCTRAITAPPSSSAHAMSTTWRASSGSSHVPRTQSLNTPAAGPHQIWKSRLRVAARARPAARHPEVPAEDERHPVVRVGVARARPRAGRAPTSTGRLGPHVVERPPEDLSSRPSPGRPRDRRRASRSSCRARRGGWARWAYIEPRASTWTLAPISNMSGAGRSRVHRGGLGQHLLRATARSRPRPSAWFTEP